LKRLPVLAGMVNRHSRIFLISGVCAFVYAFINSLSFIFADLQFNVSNILNLIVLNIVFGLAFIVFAFVKIKLKDLVLYIMFIFVGLYFLIFGDRNNLTGQFFLAYGTVPLILKIKWKWLTIAVITICILLISSFYIITGTKTFAAVNFIIMTALICYIHYTLYHSQEPFPELVKIKLTREQKEILQHIAKGAPIASIANETGFSESFINREIKKKSRTNH
jgi:hypothetical protein